MNTVRERFINKRTTARTSLRCIPGVNEYYASTSIFSFVGDKLHQLKPGGIGDGFSQAVVMKHPFSVQLFKSDYAVLIDQSPAEFMGEILPSVGYPLVDMRHGLASKHPGRRSLINFREFPLGFSQISFIPPQKSGIRHLLTIGQSGKTCEANIDANRLFGYGQRRRFHLATKAGIPLTCRMTAERQCFKFSLNRPVKFNLKNTELSHFDTVIIKGKPKLGIREAIISSVTTETGVARLLTSLDSAKESFERKVNSFLHILKHLGIDHRKGRAFLFPLWEKSIGSIEADRHTILLPGIFTKGKCLIENPPAFFQYAKHCCGLPLSRISAVLKSLTHITIIAQFNANRKGRLIHPRLKIRGFLSQRT